MAIPTKLIPSCIALLLLAQGSLVAQTLELEVNTSTTQSEGLTQPPQGVRQIEPGSDPATTVDMPLSLIGELILESVCDAQIDPQKALSVMPDLSELHIQRACPKRLDPKPS